MPRSRRRCRSLPRGKAILPRIDVVCFLIFFWNAALLCEAFVHPRMRQPRRSRLSWSDAVRAMSPRTANAAAAAAAAAAVAAAASSPRVDLPRVGPRTGIDADDSTAGDRDGPNREREQERFLVHRGKSADMIFRAPAISGITVCRNWSPAATQALRDATQELVRKNPILSGIVVRQGGNSIVTGELWIEAGGYPPDDHSFVNLVPVPDGVTHRNLSGHLSSAASSTEALAYLTDRIEPCFHHLATSTARQAEKQLPLLDVSIMVVPRTDEKEDGSNNDKDKDGDYAIFSLTVSHAVGDGVTFFQILRQLSVLVSRLDPSRSLDGSAPQLPLLPLPDVDWSFRSSSRADHEIYPVTYSRRDVDVAYGLPFWVGLVKSAILTLTKRTPAILLLDKDKVKAEKLKMRKHSNCTSISSNDVVSLALCESNDDSDLFIFTENARDGDSIPWNAGGNYFWEIPFNSDDAVRNPRQFRAVVESKRPTYPTDGLPLQPFACGRVGRLTSLATVVMEPILYGSVETVCTFPVTSFLVGIPLDVALIFRYNKRCLGVLHNFVQLEGRGGSLLDSILVREP